MTGELTQEELSGRDARAFRRLFSEANDWPATPVTRRYIILSTPRTGSTMLASALTASGLAGRPHEYLSPINLNLYRRFKGPLPLAGILLDYQSRRTSPNGYFATKMHYSHLTALFGNPPGTAAATFLQSFDRHILCVRRDKIDQAISRLLASEPGGEWSNAPGEVTTRAAKVDDVAEIGKHIAAMTRAEVRWRGLTAALKLNVHEVAYEELTSDTSTVLAGVFDFLGISLPRGNIPAPTTKKLPNAVNRELRAAYLSASQSGARGPRPPEP